MSDEIALSTPSAARGASAPAARRLARTALALAGAAACVSIGPSRLNTLMPIVQICTN